MKVRELIARLQQFDPELPVCLADWNEGYAPDNEPSAAAVQLIENGRYEPQGGTLPDQSSCVPGSYVVIGR